MDMRLPPDVVPASAPPAALPAFTYAFQPIVDAAARHVHAYEALIRGPQGEPARHVLQRVPAERRFEFDQIGRAAAIGRRDQEPGRSQARHGADHARVVRREAAGDQDSTPW